MFDSNIGEAPQTTETAHPPTVVSMLEDLETYADHPTAVLAIVAHLRNLFDIPDRRDAVLLLEER